MWQGVESGGNGCGLFPVWSPKGDPAQGKASQIVGIICPAGPLDLSRPRKPPMGNVHSLRRWNGKSVDVPINKSRPELSTGSTGATCGVEAQAIPRRENSQGSQGISSPSGDARLRPTNRGGGVRSRILFFPLILCFIRRYSHTPLSPMPPLGHPWATPALR